AELMAVIAKNCRVVSKARAAAAEVPVALDDFLRGGSCSEGSHWSASLLLPGTSAAKTPTPGPGFALWLGGADDALDLAALRHRGISAIVNMALAGCLEEQASMRAVASRYGALTTDCKTWQQADFTADWYGKSLASDDFQYLAINAQDRPDFPISESFDEVEAFLRRCQAAERAVLVHCMQGINRSAAVCASFLARSQGLDPELGSCEVMGVRRAVDWISQRRHGVLSNTGFLHQLVVHGAPEAPWDSEVPLEAGDEEEEAA
ncbi:unnamed protein product, partial [Polarella glacialis]